MKKEYVDFETGQVFKNAEAALRMHQLKKEDEQREKQKEEANKNPPFIQLTKGVSPSALSRIANESAIAIQVLMFFFENMDDYNVIMVSQKTIANSINKTRQAVNTAIKVLEEQGAIGIAKVSNSNVYIINPAIAWQKGYKLRGYVKMKATVLLGEEENKKLFERFEKIYENTSLQKRKKETISTKIIKENEIPPRTEEQQANFEAMQAQLAEFEAMQAQLANEENLENDDEGGYSETTPGDDDFSIELGNYE